MAKMLVDKLTPQSSLNSILGSKNYDRLLASFLNTKMFGKLIKDLSLVEARMAVAYLLERLRGNNVWLMAMDDARKAVRQGYGELETVLEGQTIADGNPYHPGDWIELLQDVRDSYGEVYHSKGEVVRVERIHDDGKGLMFFGFGVDYHNCRPAKPPKHKEKKHGKKS